MSEIFQTRFKKVLLVWAVLVFISGLIYAMASGSGLSSLLGFFFLLLAETVAAAAFVFYLMNPQKMGSPLMTTGLISSTILYLVVSAIISLVFITGLTSAIRFLVAPQIILLVLFVSVVLIFMLSSKSNKDAQVERRVSLVVGMEQRARSIHAKLAGKNPEAARLLEKIIEEIKYFDKNSEVRTDKTITDKLLDLDNIISSPPPQASASAGELPAGTNVIEGSSPEAPSPALQEDPISMLNEIYQLTQVRNSESLQAKRGSI
jgi:hypothetical protein